MFKNFSLFLLSIFLFGLTMPAWTQENNRIDPVRPVTDKENTHRNTGRSNGVDKEKVAELIDGLLARKSLQTAKIGLYFISLDNPGDPIYTHNGDESLVPASCMKLATSAATLDYLGPNYTFETKVYAKGNVDGNGILHGDLILYGTGDPSMSDRFPPHRITAALESLADQVAQAGIKKVEGNVIGDGTYFDNHEIGEGWSQAYLHDWYAAKVTALDLNDNCINFKVFGGKKAGEPARVEFYPDTAYAILNNGTKTVGKGGKTGIGYDRKIGSREIHIFGTIPVGRTEGPSWVSVDDPLEFTAQVFKEVLEKKGVAISGSAVPVRQPSPSAVTPDAKEIAKHISPPLSELLKPLLKNSQNLYAEIMLKTLGKVKYGEGSYKNGLKAVLDFMQKTGMDLTGYQQFDGSGLSPYNHITPHQLVEILETMHRHEYSQVFYDAMSIPGKDGSLKSRLHDLSDVMRGKTGGINNVRTLTVYLKTKSGDHLAFSIMSNNFSSREAVRLMENELVEKLAQF